MQTSLSGATLNAMASTHKQPLIKWHRLVKSMPVVRTFRFALRRFSAANRPAFRSEIMRSSQHYAAPNTSPTLTNMPLAQDSLCDGISMLDRLDRSGFAGCHYCSKQPRRPNITVVLDAKSLHNVWFSLFQAMDERSPQSCLHGTFRLWRPSHDA